MFSTKYDILYSIAIFIPAIYLWRRVYKTYKELTKIEEQRKLFHERHNCVIMYSRAYVRGWPPKPIQITPKNIDRLLEPYLYFINTAKHKLDIAAMQFSIQELLNALIDAAKRGVKVRLIANFLSVKSLRNEYRMLVKAGIKVSLYVDKTEKLQNIMHCKFMVKDYHKHSGYLCMGSMNFTGLSTLLNNYEDIVFLTNIYVVKAFSEYFEKIWDFILNDNQDIYNKNLLCDAGFHY